MARVTTPERFWSLVRQSVLNDACWEWLGRKDEKGYGRIGFGGKPNRRAHRVAWETQRGSIPEGQCVLHRCDNPGCVRPSHLFLGTQAENIADRHKKGRDNAAKAGSKHFKAKLTDAQVREMRALHGRGWTQQRLADRFGVSRGNVSKIVNRRSYV